MNRFLIFAVVISACAGPDDGSGSNIGRVTASLTASGNTNGMTIQPTQGKPLGVKEIIVTIEKVTAHSNTAGWVNLSSSETRVDILKLADYAVPLGFQNVPAGKVTQLRLYVKEGGEQYVTRDDGMRIDLKVPSGIQSGIKLHGMFDVNGCQATNVPLQIDGKRSIWVHPTGQGDLWILRPVIRTGKIDAQGMPCVPPVSGGGGGPGNSGEIPPEGGAGGPGTGGTGGGTGSIGGTGGGTSSGGTGGGSGGVIEDPGNPGMPPPPGPLGGTGTICTTPSMCLSGICSAGTCGQGGADAPCSVGPDCVSGTCTAGTCAPGNAVGAGAPCSSNTACLSGACVAGRCEPGGQGTICIAAGDCLSGYVCTAGACQAPIN